MPAHRVAPPDEVHTVAVAVLDAITAMVALLLAEIQAGDGLPLSAAAREFPGHRGGRALNPATVHRWAHKGVRGPDGRLVKLAVVRVGARWLTTRGAVARFAAELTAAAAPPAAPPRSPAARARASKAAAAELEKLGA